MERHVSAQSSLVRAYLLLGSYSVLVGRSELGAKYVGRKFVKRFVSGEDNKVQDHKTDE